MEAEHIPFIVLASLPIALVIFGICAVKNKILAGRVLGPGVIAISAILSILYIDWYICNRSGSFCELMGLMYYILIVEAIFLIFLFFSLEMIIQVIVQKYLRRRLIHKRNLEKIKPQF